LGYRIGGETGEEGVSMAKFSRKKGKTRGAGELPRDFVDPMPGAVRNPNDLPPGEELSPGAHVAAMVDRMRCMLDKASPDALFALRILYCLDSPTETHTREWAMDTVRQIAGGYELGNLFIKVVGGTIDFRDREYILPKTPRAQKIDVNGNLQLAALLDNIDGTTRGLPSEQQSWPDEHEDGTGDEE